MLNQRPLTETERKALKFYEEVIKAMPPEKLKKRVEMTEALAEFKEITGRLPA